MTKDTKNKEEAVVVREMPTIKKLTLAEIKKQSKLLDGQREFTVVIGEQEYKMSHDVTFRTTKKHQLLDDTIAFFSKGAEDTNILELATPYTALLVLKHFTTLEVSDDIGEALDLLNVLVDLEILDKIVNELPEDEVTNLYQLLTETVDNLRVSLEEAEEDALIEGLTSEIKEEVAKNKANKANKADKSVEEEAVAEVVAEPIEEDVVEEVAEEIEGE